MAIKSGVNRNELMLLPESVEDYVNAENPVRVIDAFIEGLDLSKLGIDERGANSIGPGHYDRRALLKLFLYGYLNRIYSSRELEKATHRNLEVIWLLRKLQPDHWTINEFRKNNSKALKGLFKRFHLLCGHLGLFGKDLIGIDSAYFKASNSKAKNHSKGKLSKRLKLIDERIEKYLQELQCHQCNGKASETENSKISDQLKELEEKRLKVEQLLKQVNESETGQVSEVDRDARSLQKGGQKVVGYHLQIAVDDKHHLIVSEHTDKNSSDREQLLPMCKRSKEALQVNKLNVVADAGYYSIDGIRQCHKNSIAVTVPMRKHTSGIIDRKHFKYDPNEDVLLCPKGKILHRHKDSYYQASKTLYRTYYNVSACRTCTMLKQCSKGKYRKVQVLEPEPAIEALKERLQKQPELMRKRAAMVEHPFGSMKFWMGAYAVKTRGWEKVSAELSLTCLAYNIKRVIKIVGVKELLKTIREQSCFASFYLYKCLRKHLEGTFKLQQIKIELLIPQNPKLLHLY